MVSRGRIFSVSDVDDCPEPEPCYRPLRMTLSVEREQGHLVIRQQMVPVARYIFGIPLLLAGLGLLGLAVSAVITAAGEGVDAMLVAGLGAFWLLLFAALTAPLGWWLTLARRSIVVESGGRHVIERLDWRIGRREKRRATAAFRAVRVAVEPVNDSPTSRGPTTWAQYIRLLPKPGVSEPSFEVGILDLEARTAAVAAAGQIAGALSLPLEVADPEARLQSPEREANDREVDDEPEA